VRPTTGRSGARKAVCGAISLLSSSGNFDASGASESSRSIGGSIRRHYRRCKHLLQVKHFGSPRPLSERADGDSYLCKQRRSSVEYSLATHVSGFLLSVFHLAVWPDALRGDEAAPIINYEHF
jgi:hypothetical protein